MQLYSRHAARSVMAGVCSVWLIMSGTAMAQGTWIEELGNFLAFYQTAHPGLDWTPYIDELTRARDGMRAGDQLTVNGAMNEFQAMLRMRAHGIDAEAAEDLYNLTLTMRPYEKPSFGMQHELGTDVGRLIRGPEERGLLYEGNVRCHEGGCDYWRD